MSVLGWAKQLLGQPESALVDAKSARQWLGALPANDPIKALGELTSGLRMLQENKALKLIDRLEIVLLFDETALAYRNRLTREYLSQTRLSSYRENVLWLALHHFWSCLFDSYAQCLDLAQSEKTSKISHERLLLFILRGLHAGRHGLKWRFLRYASIDGKQWRAVSRFMVVAENNHLNTAKAALYPAVATTTTPQSEFLKLLLLGVSATDSLLPVQSEIASRLIDFVVDDCEWSAQQSTHLLFCFDMVGELAPMRVVGAPPTAGVWRFFCGHPALPKLESIRKAASDGVLLAGIQLGGEYPLRLVAQVVEHLIRYWSNPAPERRSERYSSYRRVDILFGFAQVVRRFALPEQRVSDVDAEYEHVELTDPGAAHPIKADKGLESWVVENISQNGLGASVGGVLSDWLQVGQLLALSLQEPEEPWAVGVVRRLHQTAPGQTYVGIEILGRSVEAVRLNLCGMNLQEDEFALVLDKLSEREFKLLTRVGTLGTDSAAVLEYQGQRCAIRPRCWLEKGDCFDLAIVFKQPTADEAEGATETPC